jgi:hypothetical protein
MSTKRSKDPKSAPVTTGLVVNNSGDGTGFHAEANAIGATGAKISVSTNEATRGGILEKLIGFSRKVFRWPSP